MLRSDDQKNLYERRALSAARIAVRRHCEIVVVNPCRASMAARHGRSRRGVGRTTSPYSWRDEGERCVRRPPPPSVARDLEKKVPIALRAYPDETSEVPRGDFNAAIRYHGHQ